MTNKSKKKNSNKFIKTLNIAVIISFVVVVLFMGRIAVFKTVGGVNLTDFQASRMLQKQVLYSQRGDILDVNGTPIAQTLPSYNMYAILDPAYSSDVKDDGPKLHVTNPADVAQKIAPIIGMDVAEMAARLATPQTFQVEFAPFGNGLTQNVKDQIENLGLEGINFTSRDSRRYPQGSFASHIVGYASYDSETEHLRGKMGIELELEKYLIGEDGMQEYQTNANGQKLKSTPEQYKAPRNGDDVYLTIDSYVQRKLDHTMQELQAKHQPQWGIVAIADPKTGAILGVSQTPTFDPNQKDISNYTNYLVENEFEVGSIMKTITYASAIDNGKYNGQNTLYSGKYNIDDWTIYDWNKSGWGQITFDAGLCHSSNTAIANVVTQTMTKDEQKEYFKRFGFGQTTGLEVTEEATGTFALDNVVGQITSGYGQGTTATMAQMLEAYSAIANDGKMMQLHLIDKVVNQDSGARVYQHEPIVKKEPISPQTAEYVTKLMVDTVNDSKCSSSKRYMMKSGVFAGKTGTANVADPNGGYLPSYDQNYTYAFGGFAPADNPRFVVISAVSLPKIDPTGATATVINSVTDDINNYLSLVEQKGGDVAEQQQQTSVVTINNFPSFMNRRKEDTLNYLNFLQIHNVVFVGNGEQIINQNITPYSMYVSNQRIIMLTDGETIQLPNFNGWSRKEIEVYASFAGLDVTFEGEGYAQEQSLAEGTTIMADNRAITIKLVI